MSHKYSGVSFALPSRCVSVPQCVHHTRVSVASKSTALVFMASPVASPLVVIIMRRNAVNDLIKRALASANVPSVLEPNSLSIDDGKRPVGLTVLPWANGRSMIWKFTCPDTMATSHLNRSALFAGAAANDAKRRTVVKYRLLSALMNFVPVAVESLGALGEEASDFFRNLGHQITSLTTNPRSFQFLMQRLSVAVQHGKVVFYIFLNCLTLFLGCWLLSMSVYWNIIILVFSDGLETLTLKTARRPRRDRDETLRNSRPLRGVINVISCSHQG